MVLGTLLKCAPPLLLKPRTPFPHFHSIPKQFLPFPYPAFLASLVPCPAQDVGIVPSIVAAFDAAAGFVIAANHITAIVLTSGVR